MAYLSASEYLNRFGERETVIITNETPGAQSYDSQKLADALEDATADAEGWIGTRYTVPLADPPRIVKGWVAHLAREKLYLRNPPETVKDNADAARSALLGVANGKVTLPIAEGETPPEVNSSGTALTSDDAPCPTFSDRRMAAFMAPFGCGDAYDPCWRR